MCLVQVWASYGWLRPQLSHVLHLSPDGPCSHKVHRAPVCPLVACRLWTLVPRNFPELAARLSNSGTTAVREAASLPEHSLQLQLIADQKEQFMLSLTSAGLKAAEQLSNDSYAAEGSEEEGDVAGDPGREANWATLRHTAHVALMLRGLGLLREPDMLGMQADAEEQYNLLR